jgi:hypothetical protein
MSAFPHCMLAIHPPSTHRFPSFGRPCCYPISSFLFFTFRLEAELDDLQNDEMDNSTEYDTREYELEIQVQYFAVPH